MGCINCIVNGRQFIFVAKVTTTPSDTINSQCSLDKFWLDAMTAELSYVTHSLQECFARTVKCPKYNVSDLLPTALCVGIIDIYQFYLAAKTN